MERNESPSSEVRSSLRGNLNRLHASDVCITSQYQLIAQEVSDHCRILIVIARHSRLYKKGGAAF